MFGIGATEMIVIGLVILMLFSPRELPGMMKTLARAYGSVRRTAEEFRAQVMDAEELREPIEEIRAAYHGTKTELLSAQELARRELGRARAETMKAQQKLSELAREESRREASVLKGRVSASESPDAPRAVGAAASATVGPGAPVGTAPASASAPVGTAAVPSSATVPTSTPAGTVGPGSPVPASAPVGTATVPSSASVPASAPAGAVGPGAPSASSAPSVATANTVPSPPVTPTPAPPPPVVSTAPVSSPSYASPSAPSRASDRSDAA